MNKDIHVLYSGGSGGHICTHLILESCKHFCRYTEFPMPVNPQEFKQSFYKIKQEQWAINNPASWKKNEFWPLNDRTQQCSVTDMNRLFLTCNPKLSDVTADAVNVLIYTDIDTQLSISAFKHCYVFAQVNDIEKFCYNYCNSEWLSQYNAIKDKSWPNVDLCNIELLPSNIIDEMQSLHHGFNAFIDWKSNRDILQTYKQLTMLDKNVKYIYNVPVHSTVADMAPTVNYAVKLQDIARSRGKCLLDTLGLPWHRGHETLMNHWLSLHPKELQEKLLG